MIPKPFSRVLIRAARRIVIPSDVSDEQMELYFAEMQAALDRTREFAESHVAKVGGPDFPTTQYRPIV